MAMVLEKPAPTATIVDSLSHSFVTGKSVGSATLLCREPYRLNDYSGEDQLQYASWYADLSGQCGRTHRQLRGEVTSESAVQDVLTRRAVLAIQELTRLERGWDGRHAVPVEESVAESAIAFVRQLRSGQLGTMRSVPFADGRLQLEWDRGERSLELEFANASDAHYLKWDPSEGIEEEGSVSPIRFPALNGLVSWFFNG
jgi:hypothetical protein